MYDKGPAGWRAVTADAVVARGPVLIHSAAVRPSAGVTAVAILYDGQNAVAPRRFGVQSGIDAQTQLTFRPPLLFERGLFVDLDASTVEVLVSYSPVRDDPPPAAVEGQ